MRGLMVSLACVVALALVLAAIFAVGLFRLHASEGGFASADPAAESPATTPRVEAPAGGATGPGAAAAATRQAAAAPAVAPEVKPTPAAVAAPSAAAAPSVAAAPAAVGRPEGRVANATPARDVKMAAGHGDAGPRVLVQAELAQAEIVLGAADAKLDGPGFRLTGQGTIGWWDDPASRARWRVRLAAPTTFEVRLNYSCGGDGREFEVEGAGNTLRGRSHGTGGWTAFQTRGVGRVTLPAGESVVSIHPVGGGGALMNLRSIELVPLPGEAPNRRLAIRSATYFAPFGGGHADVTERVRSAVRNDALSIPVENEALGGDPAHGIGKKLRVDYTFEGRDGTATINEHNRMTLPPATR